MTAPASQFARNTGPAQPFEVRLGDDVDDPPTEKDVAENHFVMSVTRSAGGHRLDHAELHYSLADAGQDLVDMESPTEQAVKCEIHLVDPAGGDTVGCVFSGELATSAIRIDRGESQLITARIEPWHFGNPLLGPRVLDIDGETILEPSTKIIFQPEIDGVIEDNMATSILQDSPTADYDDYAPWVDPEAVRTIGAQIAKQVTPAPWTLSHAVHSLCWVCNPDEDFIANPTLDELKAVFEPDDTIQEEETEPDASDEDQPEDDEEPAPPPAKPENQSPELRNVELPRGHRLPHYLDLLLPRFGYNWFVEPVLEETDEAGDPLDPPQVKNHIRVFELGAGHEVQLYLQRPANPSPALDITQSNVSDLAVEYNWADVANEIIGQGSVEEYEATFELYRGWKENEDGYNADQLRKTDDGEDVSDDESVFKQHPNAWRKWVLNEAGDYCSTRTLTAPIPAAPFDLKPLLGPNTEAKRRKFWHCLTKDLAGERRDIYLQYRDPAVAHDGDAGAWKSIPLEGAEVWTMAGFDVLEKECGIYFSGSTPPPDLMEFESEILGAARLRVTACLRGDDRVTYTAVRQPQSPNANTIQLFVDLSDRFHRRLIQDVDIPGTGSEPTIYKSALLYEIYGDYTIDDTQLLTDYCKSLRTLEQAARISCEFEVAGIQTAYQIGQLVTAVNGRNIRFNRNASDHEEKLYPQITAITFDRAKQRTRLRVETFDFSAKALRKLSL